MNITDKNIKKLLIVNDNNHSVDSELENTTMSKINNQKDYIALLPKTKRKAKIGMILSLFLLITFEITIYFELFTSRHYTQSNFEAFYPSILTTVVVILVYIEMLFGMAIFKKNDK